MASATTANNPIAHAIKHKRFSLAIQVHNRMRMFVMQKKRRKIPRRYYSDPIVKMVHPKRDKRPLVKALYEYDLYRSEVIRKLRYFPQEAQQYIQRWLVIANSIAIGDALSKHIPFQVVHIDPKACLKEVIADRMSFRRDRRVEKQVKRLVWDANSEIEIAEAHNAVGAFISAGFRPASEFDPREEEIVLIKNEAKYNTEVLGCFDLAQIYHLLRTLS